MAVVVGSAFQLAQHIPEPRPVTDCGYQPASSLDKGQEGTFTDFNFLSRERGMMHANNDEESGRIERR
jgi:hypothetical protein